MNWDETALWIKSLDACGGGWRMATIEELRELYDPKHAAGAGAVRDRRAKPVHLDPVFAAIGHGSWAWTSQTREDTAISFSFTHGTGAIHNRTNATFASRAFAVRPSSARTRAPIPPR
jgi:hypothetical protein